MSQVPKKINLNKSVLGCALILFIHTGINSVATAAMPQLKLYYGVELSTIIAGASACSLMMFIGGFIGAKFIRKVRPKGAFIIGSLCAALYAFLIILTNQVWGFYLGCAAVGLTAAWGGHATSIIYINRFNPKKAGTLISLLLTISCLGSALFQFLTGKFLSTIGLKGIYMSLIGMAFLAILLNLLLVENIDADEAQVSNKIVKHSTLFKMSSFRKMVIVTILSGTLCGSFGTLCTTFFQSHGIALEISTIFLSGYTLCCGLLAVISGIVVDKFGYKAYAVVLYASFSLAIGCAILFDCFEIVFVIPIMILLFGLASPIASSYNMLSKPVFKEKALDANTKLLSFGSLGSAILLPTYTKFYELFGFTKLWFLLLTISILCFILLFSTIKEMKSLNKQKEGVIYE